MVKIPQICILSLLFFFFFWVKVITGWAFDRMVRIPIGVFTFHTGVPGFRPGSRSWLQLPADECPVMLQMNVQVLGFCHSCGRCGLNSGSQYPPGQVSATAGTWGMKQCTGTLSVYLCVFVCMYEWMHVNKQIFERHFGVFILE